MDLSTTPYDSLKFPQLAPRYQGMPRRYEETKPVIIQDFTHRKIIGIGHDIQSRLLERLEAEKQEAIDVAEKATWEKAEKKKNSAVNKVREEAEKKIEQRLEQQKIEFEQILKEEVLRVELAMQQEAIEKVKEEHARGEKVMAATAKEIREQCAKEQTEAIAVARKEEQLIAAGKIEYLKLKHQNEILGLLSKEREENCKKVALLKARKDQELKAAVKQVRAEVQEEKDRAIKELKNRYETALEHSAATVKEKVNEAKATRRYMYELKTEKERLADFLVKTRFWFQDFIDRVQKVKKGQADFMLPSAYIEEIERGLMEAQP